MASADNVAASTMTEVTKQTCVDADTLPDTPSRADYCPHPRYECLSVSSQTKDIERSELRDCGESEHVEVQEPQHEGGEDSLSRPIKEGELQENTLTRVQLENEDFIFSDDTPKVSETPRTRTRCLSLGSYDTLIHIGLSSLSSLPMDRRASLSLPCSGLNIASSSQHADQLPEELRVLPSDVCRSLTTPDDTTSCEAPSDITAGSSTPAVSYVDDLGWGAGTFGRMRPSLGQNSYGWKNPRQVCHHRLNLAYDGPPCYLCSISDLPPTYHNRDNVGLKKVKKRLMVLFQGLATLHVHPAPDESQGNTQPFTISSGRCTWHDSTGGSQVTPSGTPYTLPATDINTRDYSLTQLDNAPEFHESPSYCSNPRPSSSEATQHTDDVPPHSTFGCSGRSGGGSPVVEEVPPPYSPLTPGSLVSRSTQILHLQQRENNPNTGQDHCFFSRSLHCNMIYSLLLATATTVAVMGYDKPVVILACVIVFLAVFIFMPLIWGVDSLLRCRTERPLRNTVTPQFQNSFIFPAIH